MQPIEIWKPKYSTQEILIATHRVTDGDNFIKITQDKNYENKLLKLAGEEIRKYPRQRNGKGEVFCVPISRFVVLVKKQ